MGDRKDTRSRFCELHRAIMDDGIRLGLPYQDKDLQTLMFRERSEGTSFFKVTLPLLGKALDRGLVSGTFSCPTNFALRKETRLPRFCGSVFLQIFNADGSLKGDPNLHAIQHLRQFLLFDSKLVLDLPESVKEQAVRDFGNRQESLRGFKITPDNPVLREATLLLSKVLRGLDLTEIVPGHGPGAVAEKINRGDRWDFSYWLSKAERNYPLQMYGTPSIRALMSRTEAVRYSRKAITRICLVPKDFRAPRLISAECAVNQFLQQGQMKKMMTYIDHHYLLRRSIRLHDQTFNRSAASKAYENNQATLDLSNASDTLSVTLFWTLFSGVPKLRRQLMCTRSDFARYGETLVKITAFAPMGSATCFPTETLIFWALAMASVRLNRPLSVSSPLGCKAEKRRYMSWKEISSQVSVFGDDIVIPTDCLDLLITTLISVGCSPNMSKTCWKTPFRESCGGEWFNGTPVTIVRNRRYHYDDSKKIAHYPVLLDLQRKFYVKGYKSTAACLHRLAEEIWPVYTRTFPALPQDPHLAEVSDSSPFDCSFGPSPSLSKGIQYRFNRSYQRLEYRVPVVFQPSQVWGTEGYPRLFARLLSDQVDRLAIRDSNVKIAWRHLPFYMGLNSPIEA